MTRQIDGTSTIEGSIKRATQSKGTPGLPQQRPANKKGRDRARKAHQYAAAVVIQCCVRMFVSRIRVRKQRLRVMLTRRRNGAMYLQTWWRGYRARRQFRQVVFEIQARAVMIIQSRFRGVRGKNRVEKVRREKIESARENTAATTLQSVMRGKTVRSLNSDDNEHH